VLSEKLRILETFIVERPRGIFKQNKDILTSMRIVIIARTKTLAIAKTKVNAVEDMYKIPSIHSLHLNNLASKVIGVKAYYSHNKTSIDDAPLVKIRNYFTDNFF
jgi:hypothetical protein